MKKGQSKDAFVLTFASFLRKISRSAIHDHTHLKGILHKEKPPL
jgi:hypothetical protein